MANVTEKLKETLVGTEVETETLLSDSTRSIFQRNALKNEETGEQYLGRQEFIEAVAPAGEDYVGILWCRFLMPVL